MCLGIPGRILDIREESGLRMGTVDFGGVRRDACLAYTPTAAVGTYVIVHVGFAIAEVDEAEAERTLAVLRAMAGAVEAELGEPLPGPAAWGRSARTGSRSAPGTAGPAVRCSERPPDTGGST
ncbi:HypC/HybG/HupF family hydrogenase formation chaperone [Streptomyces venezuelae]|uniref:HypC/HybG/HupF family hydrogenase formation chaperone n=1 Tax=Streptomyces venezuelae TaxID=54571 RepID=UPI0037A1ECD1